jgi:hypothetical protein
MAGIIDLLRSEAKSAVQTATSRELLRRQELSPGRTTVRANLGRGRSSSVACTGSRRQPAHASDDLALPG